ncbi:hypothetical protein FQZ97_978320 [compost metagenome]
MRGKAAALDLQALIARHGGGDLAAVLVDHAQVAVHQRRQTGVLRFELADVCHAGGQLVAMPMVVLVGQGHIHGLALQRGGGLERQGGLHQRREIRTGAQVAVPVVQQPDLLGIPRRIVVQDVQRPV